MHIGLRSISVFIVSYLSIVNIALSIAGDLENSVITNHNPIVKDLRSHIDHHHNLNRSKRLLRKNILSSVLDRFTSRKTLTSQRRHSSAADHYKQLQFIYLFSNMAIDFKSESEENESYLEELEAIESSVLLTINEPNNPQSVIYTPFHEKIMNNISWLLQTYAGINAGYWLNVCKVFCYFFLWYFFTVVYNISNKKFLNEVSSPLSVAAIQMIFGIPMFLPLWLMKPVKYPKEDLYTHIKIATMHGLGNCASVISFGSGSVSFAHVVKALEPVVAAGLSIWITKKVLPPLVYITIVPIVVGVAIASATEVTFTWIGFVSAMLSNLFYQMRMVLAKEEMGSDKPKISPANLFRIITIIAVIELIPIAISIEGITFLTKWNAAIARGVSKKELMNNLIISGISYYMYNEVAFWLLEIVHPVTHAVGNTIKRVVIILASVLILKSPVNIVGMSGALLAVAGTLMYSLAQQRCKSNVS